jgi:ketosteroid isomerase-like protein
MDRIGFQDWLDRYVAAWKSYDPKAIGDLFSEDAEYRYHPQDEPVRGRDAIVASWLDDPDARGRYDAHYEPLAIDGENHVAHGWSRYYAEDGKTLEDEYDNIYLVRFDADGRCREFTEWWIQSRRFRKAAEGDAPAA